MKMGPAWRVPRSAYVHVPFCAQRCDYCDFAIAVGKDRLGDAYLDAMGAELATLGQPWTVQTLFVGGGTPSQLDTRQLARLLGHILRWLPPEAGHEFSIEANPDSLTADKMAVLADHGVNRVSLGAQSFEPRQLRLLGRSHDAAEIARAVERSKRRSAQVSLDLIFAVPGQTCAQWEADLEHALALQPDHLSIYGLTWEKGTPLWKRRRRNEIQSLDEETERTLYACAIDRLEAAGFEQYELSNFARPGFRCRHNGVYWANWAYLGFGMGAARYVNGRRELNTRDLHGYIRRALAGEPTTFQSEELDPAQRARETLALGLRRSEGLDRQAFRLQTGFDLDELTAPALERCQALGLLHDDGLKVALTREGRFVADTIIADLYAGGRPSRFPLRS
jgi:oxygen-independent coproporphyrinogen-3 oxidase